MKTTTKRISLLFWLTIVALHLLVSALPAPGTCAPKLNNADWQILPLSQSSRVKGARLTELQTGSLINASHGVLVVAQSGLSNPVIGLVRMLPAPESGAMVPQNVFAYQPGPRGFVIQQDGPLVTGNQAAVAQGDLSGVINDPAQMLPAPRPGSFNPDLPGAPIVSFEVGDGGLFLPAARAHGPNPYGSFLSLDPITNQAYVRGRLANLPQWNPAT
jgi:hypothetical protein